MPCAFHGCWHMLAPLVTTVSPSTAALGCQVLGDARLLMGAALDPYSSLCAMARYWNFQQPASSIVLSATVSTASAAVTTSAVAISAATAAAPTPIAASAAAAATAASASAASRWALGTRLCAWALLYAASLLGVLNGIPACVSPC